MSDEGGNGWAYGLLIMSAVTLVLLSMLIPFCCPKAVMDDGEITTVDKLNDQFTDFTGSRPTSESVWALKGIYTPYGVDQDGNPYEGYGYTEDGWLYGARIVNYTPTQYTDKAVGYSASYDSESGIYYYSADSDKWNKHSQGDLYGAVVMDVNKQSSIFFTSSGKHTEGDYFYYAFDGYRYSFSPVDPYTTLDQDGNEIKVTPNTSSLSLIWYNWLGDSGGPGGTGIAGQLIIQYDRGVAYITGANIVSAFNQDTSTSRFTMAFNGVDMFISIRLDPVAIANGLSVEECYNLGYWSIMVSSRSVDADSILGADYEFNIYTMFDTMVDLLTFDMNDYGLTGVAGQLASLTIMLPLFIGLIVLGLTYHKVLIFAGIYGVISAWNFFGGM